MAGLSCKKIGALGTCSPNGCSPDHDCTDPVTCVTDECCEKPCGKVTVKAGATATAVATGSVEATASAGAEAEKSSTASAEAEATETASAEHTATESAEAEVTST